MPSEKIIISFLKRKQTVNSSSDLTAHIPIIKWCRQYEYIAIFHGRINFAHIIPLDTRTLLAAVSAKAASTAVNIHTVQKELCHGVSSDFRTLGKGFHKGRCISVFPWTAVEYYNFFAHTDHSVPSRFFLQEQLPAHSRRYD